MFPKEPDYIFVIQILAGYFLAAIVAEIVSWAYKKTNPEVSKPPQMPVSASSKSTTLLCQKCGTPASPNASFCSKCGYNRFYSP
jgi:ribosomal protein L40E